MSVSVEVVRSSVDHAAYTRPPAQLEDVIFSPAYGGRVIVPDSKPKGAPPPRPGSAPKGGRPADAPPRPGSAPKGGRPADAVAVVLDALSKTDVEKEKLSTGADVEDSLEKDALKKLEEEKLKEHLALRRKEKADKKKKDKENTPAALGSEPPKDDIKASVGEDGTSKTTKELDGNSAKKEDKAKNEVVTHNAVIAILGGKGIQGLTTQRRTKCIYATHMQNVRDFFCVPIVFDKTTTTIVEYDKKTGFVSKNVIPFHIISTVCLLVWKEEERAFINTVCKRWTELQSFCLDLCAEDEDDCKLVLDHILKRHLAVFPIQYTGLVECSDEKGLCKTRRSCIEIWVVALKKVAKNYWETYKLKRKVVQLHGVVADQLQTITNDDNCEPDSDDL